MKHVQEVVNQPLQLSSWRPRTPQSRVAWSRPLPGTDGCSPLGRGRGRAGVCLRKPWRGHWEPGHGGGAPRPGCPLPREHGVGRGSTPKHTRPSSPLRQPARASRGSGMRPAPHARPSRAWPAQPAPAPSSPASPALRGASAAATRAPPLPAPSLREARGWVT